MCQQKKWKKENDMPQLGLAFTFLLFLHGTNERMKKRNPMCVSLILILRPPHFSLFRKKRKTKQAFDSKCLRLL